MFIEFSNLRLIVSQDWCHAVTDHDMMRLFVEAKDVASSCI